MISLRGRLTLPLLAPVLVALAVQSAFPTPATAQECTHPSITKVTPGTNSLTVTWTAGTPSTIIGHQVSFRR